MKIRIKNKEYRVDDIKDELQSKWKDGRPYIIEYYELFDEEEEAPRFLMVWSSDNYELYDDGPAAVTPILEGNVSDINRSKIGGKDMSKFNFMVKKNGDKKWRDISESEATQLLFKTYPRDEIPDQIFKLKCGHKVETKVATIEAWPKNKEN